MNKYINKIFLASAITLIGVLITTSCTDYLDKSPNSDIAENDPYKNFKNFQGFIEELYKRVPIVSNNDYHTCFNYGEEEYWEPQEIRLFARNIDYGDFWGWTTCFYSYPTTRSSGGLARNSHGNLWQDCWYGIRKANIGIANLDKLVNVTEEERQLLEGQLYFFRAWFHFMLMEWWGGMPYIDEVIPSDVTPTLSRLTWQVCAEKCVADFDHAIPLLPVDWDQTTVGKVTLGNNNSRINKVMALAYKGKTLLWAGSPLMNWASGGTKEYNAGLCKRAADAFGDALKIIEETGRYELAPMANYNEIFLVHNSNGKLNGLKEAIFRENLVDYDGRWRWNMINDFRPTSIESTGIKSYPTANYVNYFGMQNGYPIKNMTQADPEAGYDPAYPWKDRDPRFYKTIMFDGVKWQSTGGAGGSSELFTNGRESEEKDEKKGCFTGYMNCKLCPQLMNTVDGYKENNIMVLSLMRLADVYLMYSEATAVGYGTPQSKALTFHKTAEDAINEIRRRAGVEDVLDRFTGNTTDFLSEVRRERAVELAFEGFRFMDLRRWMLIGQAPYNRKTKIEFDRGVSADDYNYDKPEENRIKNLREEVLVERKFTDRHYWLPLPKNDVYLYEGFGQNPGW
ncbi:RagB/SusD family nutrient uptake outer membrane protein [Bacteroides sp. GM023]|uniref:RagB/SusD family nutrient uptake outer membrane protein n=1 Tax=Bacteroides sp. GM023 TaxID=2723058 RepID=UPI00168B8223|nr:RagB/SusD family nutrient uptake outer membrane protein [Bacteroides sp. GM023]MBD3590957.1 RagB/SusD family nutrient uptake outer membrane protein [Bacteroides sp. GM023]